MRIIAMPAAIALAGLILSGCSGSGGEDRKPEPSGYVGTASGTSTADVPEYRLEPGGTPATLTVSVDKAYSKSEMTAILDDLKRRHDGQDDGFFVHINCAQGQPSRLAMGKFAVGPAGAQRTGLAVGEASVDMVEGTKCPGEAPLNAPADPKAVTAQQVVDAIFDSGLPGTDVRDNSQQMCDYLTCVQFVKTEEYSVYQFPDVQTAQARGEMLGKGTVSGAILTVFDGVDPARVAEYEAAADAAIAGR
ncbi:hypothetical protein [Mycolicibacterium mageritense]|uniref:hypothetical protein n=1 Tax=Mycolicibacterium mageritense TaxID=53462 RepID=UPI001E4225DF|nr:hypothetical protein [Mycolicibacterium mageritense]GJJ22099.1 hypothetical protein MTY414_57720 [Mycolicibacterium mageritense]